VITIFYNCFIALYAAGLRLAAFWNPKARLWVKGRVGLFKKLSERVSQLPNDKHHRQRIWMHCASLGEFEQGRSVLERLKDKYPEAVIIVSFFSPSGYEIRKNYALADIVCYLPLDTPANAKQFVDIIKPTLVLWIRYEFWMHYLEELKRRNIPLLLVSGLLRDPSYFAGFYNTYRRKLYNAFTHFFVQTEDSAILFRNMGFADRVSVSGDTRFDRVIEIADRFEPVAPVAAFCEGHRVLVAGSTWTEDEEELTHYVRANNDIRFIIAPHETDIENIRDVQKEFPRSVLYSELAAAGNTGKLPGDINTLIIDNVGMLSRLYCYADITYVGGGFGDDGLHNILEAAVYGRPVFFGPVYDRHYEAIDMEAAGGAVSVENALELEAKLNELWNDAALLKQRGEAAKSYVYRNAGATEHILSYIYRNRLLTS
jgi:3-deoxy-D-manno-octulosonic-acid transferase